MNDGLTVGISDYKIARNSGTLVTYALGSCVGICIYERQLKIGGLSHVMLPDSSMFNHGDLNRMKFADTAIPDMISALKRQGANTSRLTAKIAGGAQMFQLSGNTGLGIIGERNVKAVKMVLNMLKIPIIGEDTGADYGRTLYFDVESGAVKIMSMNRVISEI